MCQSEHALNAGGLNFALEHSFSPRQILHVPVFEVHLDEAARHEAYRCACCVLDVVCYKINASFKISPN